jgi:hypothetical protein
MRSIRARMPPRRPRATVSPSHDDTASARGKVLRNRSGRLLQHVHDEQRRLPVLIELDQQLGSLRPSGSAYSRSIASARWSCAAMTTRRSALRVLAGPRARLHGSGCRRPRGDASYYRAGRCRGVGRAGPDRLPGIRVDRPVHQEEVSSALSGPSRWGTARTAPNGAAHAAATSATLVLFRRHPRQEHVRRGYILRRDRPLCG